MVVLMTVNSEVMATLCYVCPVYLFMPVKKRFSQDLYPFLYSLQTVLVYP